MLAWRAEICIQLYKDILMCQLFTWNVPTFNMLELYHTSIKYTPMFLVKKCVQDSPERFIKINKQEAIT